MSRKLTKCPNCEKNDHLIFREVLYHEASWDEDAKQFLLYKDLDNETDLVVCTGCSKELNASQFKFDYC